MSQQTLNGRVIYGIRCPVCSTMIQRAYDGTLQDGLDRHMTVVHPGE